MAKAKVVYGGPYSQETDAITLESSKEKPDYTALTSDWKTISQGALDYIQSLIHPEKPKDGPFVNNAVFKEEEPVEEEKKSNDVDLDKL